MASPRAAPRAKSNPSQPKPDQEKPRKRAWIFLDSFVRFGAFQRVTSNPKQKICRPLRASRRRPHRIMPPQGLSRSPGRQSLHANLAFPPAAAAIHQNQSAMNFEKSRTKRESLAAAPAPGLFLFPAKPAISPIRELNYASLRKPPRQGCSAKPRDNRTWTALGRSTLRRMTAPKTSCTVCPGALARTKP